MFRDKTYHDHDSFHSLVNTEAIKLLRMRDLEMDDDEWQLAAWFFEDQAKTHPLSTLDYQQDLFAVTGHFRAQQREHGFLLFSQDHFHRMYGEFPDKPMDLDQFAVCPYEYKPLSKKWINRYTGSSPLIFHFAGNEWICACEVMRAEGYKNIPPKFRDNCEKHYDHWHNRVHQGMQDIAHADDPLEQAFLVDDANESFLHGHELDLEETIRRHLHVDEETAHRMMQDDPYGSTTGPVVSFVTGVFDAFVSIWSAIFDFFFGWLFN